MLNENGFYALFTFLLSMVSFFVWYPGIKEI